MSASFLWLNLGRHGVSLFNSDVIGGLQLERPSNFGSSRLACRDASSFARGQKSRLPPAGEGGNLLSNAHRRNRSKALSTSLQ